MNQAHGSSTSRRILQWRYRTAVQAARMLNRVAAGPQERTSLATRPDLPRPTPAYRSPSRSVRLDETVTAPTPLRSRSRRGAPPPGTDPVED